MLSSKEKIYELRNLEFFEDNLGQEILNLKKDPDVIEIMLNPDRKLWVDTLSKGMYFTGIYVEPSKSISIINLVANAVGTTVGLTNPRISAEIPGDGSRFEGTLPPIVANPSFTIRKKALLVFTLDDYVKNGTMTQNQKDVIVKGVLDRKNMLVIGGTSSGKTTLTNAIINEMVVTKHRLLILEDTQEIQSKAENTVFMRTSDYANMQDLLKTCMRYRPDRIIIGEIRSGEALDLLTAWNSGHPGGISTIHSDTPEGGLKQLEQYIQRVSVSKQQELIAMTVDYLVVITKENNVRKVKCIKEMLGFKNGEYILKDIA
ncbi:P-type conjugative transfer ATPase TrbB [uncultured Fusobacterium sp.]|uniref:P-type conjugative transfer ATPase TrbB n=1 Tax=uncultured Fusobacterium sp. TaxID=159267 RepID=UPI0015A51C71|nr:P-type conjugative transfer ATPase TrbB [uncultured Fusobacterium sp.]